MRKLIVIFSLMFLCFSVSNTYAQKKLTDREIFARGHVFKPEQIVVADREYQYGTGQMIYEIERKKKETLVTFLQPIYFDSQWILYTKGYTIIDKKTGEKYPAISFADETIPFDRIGIIRGYNRKMLYITLKFPPLKKRIKAIDLMEYHVEENPVPSNNTGDEGFYNIVLKNYTPKAVAKNEKILKKYK